MVNINNGFRFTFVSEVIGFRKSIGFLYVCAGLMGFWSQGSLHAGVKAKSTSFPRLFYTTNVCALYGQDEACSVLDSAFRWYAFHAEGIRIDKRSTPALQVQAKVFMHLQWLGNHELFPLSKQRLYFQTLTLLGAKAAERGDYRATAKYLLRAELMAREIYWPYFAALMHNHLGMLYYSEQAYDKAAYHFHAAFRNILQSNEGWDEAHWTQNILNNIGLCYLKQDLPTPALSSFQRAFQIAYHTGNQSGMAYSYINWTHAVWAYFPERLKPVMVQNMLHFAHHADRQIFVGRATVIGALVYDALKQPNLAQQLLQELAPTYLIREFRYQWYYYQMLSKLAQKRGDFKAAYTFSLKQSVAADSIDRIYQAKMLQLEHVQQDMMDASNYAESIRYHIQAKSLQGRLWFAFGLLLFVVIMVIFILWFSLRKRYAKFKAVSKGLQQQNQQLHRTHRHLELTDKHKSYILSTVAHDLRNVLGNVTQVSDLLLDSPEGKLFTKENQHLMHLLGHSAKIGLFTLQDLSDAIRPDPQMQLHLHIMLPQQVLEEAQKLLFSKLKRKQISLKVENHAQFLMACDQDKTVRAITNVLDNAIKFSNPGSVIHCTLRQLPDQSTLFRIRDHGKGIPPELRATLFRPFSSGSSGTLGETSTGLGLYIVKKIMEAHGGRVWAKSAVGKGTAFYLLFPSPNLQRSGGQIYPN